MALMDEADFADPAVLARARFESWSKQRVHVAENSAFFRELWGRGTPPERLEDLPALPLCDKEMLRASQLREPPFGDYLAAPESRVTRLHRTSGTTGQAMNLALSARDAGVTAAVGGRSHRASGLGPGHRVVHCLNYRLWMGGLTDHLTLERTGATVIPFGVGDSALLVRTIRELGVDAISCTPSYPAVLAEVIERDFPGLAPADLGLRLGLFGGEAGVDDPEFARRIRETWGMEARNANYGVTDVMSNIAGQCTRCAELHFMAPDVLHAELIDPDTAEPLALEAGTTGELVLTHLERECQPLVRFRTGDVVEITGTGACACGRRTPRFRVKGRSDDMVVVRGINVFPTMVAAEVNALDGLSGEYRIRLRGPGPHDRLPLEVELAPGATAPGELAATLARAIKRSIGVTAEVTPLAPRSLPRTAGKTRRVIREE